MNHLLKIIPILFGSVGIFALMLTLGSHLLPKLMAQNEPLSVRVLTPTVPLGGVVYLHIDADRATSVRIRDGEVTIPAEQRTDGQWEAILGVWMEDKPGSRACTVEAEVDGKTVSAPATFTITRRAFPIQRLRMSKDQDDIYESPSVQEEYRLIRAAIQRETRRRWEGSFPLPTTGRVSTQYGTQRYRNGKKVGVHKGIDIAAPAGRLVNAANNGVIALRGDFELHGRTLVVDHGGGVVGLYLHLRDFGVSEGQQVKSAQKIARVGDTGVGTGAHLHYALYVHGVAVDPLLWQKSPAGL